eukprot:COSAG06_NODE_2865_length_6157_cov_30.730769_8_plen_58_part_00
MLCCAVVVLRCAVLRLGLRLRLRPLLCCGCTMVLRVALGLTDRFAWSWCVEPRESSE